MTATTGDHRDAFIDELAEDGPRFALLSHRADPGEPRTGTTVPPGGRRESGLT